MTEAFLKLHMQWHSGQSNSSAVTTSGKLGVIHRYISDIKLTIHQRTFTVGW